MMRVLIDKSQLQCGHEGKVTLSASQTWVRIAGDPILVEGDPVGRPILGCTMGATAPCTVTVAVAHGYSDLVRIDGKRVCLDPLTGPTSGAPPGFRVDDARQTLVSEKS
ncbi:hypothetical protein [Haliangium sp.]|uniref:hypothetical protein n=1 Tax=Haliangium sp. TaxID=2663208 RepID=UPI003D14F3F0